jgi:hypothetical protein
LDSAYWSHYFRSASGNDFQKKYYLSAFANNAGFVGVPANRKPAANKTD